MRLWPNPGNRVSSHNVNIMLKEPENLGRDNLLDILIACGIEQMLEQDCHIIPIKMSPIKVGFVCSMNSNLNELMFGRVKL